MVKWFLAIPFLVLLAGCGGGGDEGSAAAVRPVRLDSVTFEMAAEANERRPARVGLVQIANANLVDSLMELAAAEWFGEAGRKFRAAHPSAYYDDWEVVPGSVAGPFDLSVDENVSVVVFCDTIAGTPPLRIEEDGDIAVHIEPEGCEVYLID